MLCVGAALVGFVDNDEVPPLLPDAFSDIILLGVVDGRDDLGFSLPQIKKLLLVVCRVNDLERLIERSEATRLATEWSTGQGRE